MDSWGHFQRNCWISKDFSFLLDYSLLLDAAGALSSANEEFQCAISEMQKTEAGEIVNGDEQRMVGHYWLRNSALCPVPELTRAIEDELAHVQRFSSAVHSGEVAPKNGEKFESLLLIGIGGSALGPQLLSEAFRTGAQPLRFYSIDNTDPDGIALTLSEIPDLGKTLVLVISKSGGTKETRNAMMLTENAFRLRGLDFAKQAVAITGEGSLLYTKAKGEGWLDIFPMWDWVGGRTSLWASVGLLPSALLGVNIDQLLQGAKEMDQWTREGELRNNPAGILAFAWRAMAKSKDMVVLPYKDRLLLTSRYLQQLVMESLGKQLDRDGQVVEEGLAVYGNKGSTDQHAYIQQLRDGRNNFFAVFIEVLHDFAQLKNPGAELLKFQKESELEVEEGTTSGDYLQGFYLGTRQALAENGRASITITIPDVSARSLGAVLALFERAVSFYASLTNINAYHQPGVEAGKKAAGRVLELKAQVESVLQGASAALTVEQVAKELGSEQNVHIFKILERLVATGAVQRTIEGDLFNALYKFR
ncbi:MAG: glucose-6-phosphate isomerase [Bdellovibrionales bacterium]|nr:glucose-6-phosphate isomerase [Bdellovibrionales bacterium]